jgi:hypothetical protein
MGLMTFIGNRPYMKDVVVAQNYLNEKELRALGQLNTKNINKKH